MSKKKEMNLLYKFYTKFLFYEFCPVSMQTVSLVEDILSLSADVWYANVTDEELSSEAFNLASSYVSTLVHRVSIEFDVSLLSDVTVSTLIYLLKQRARSAAVKSYFDL